MGSAPSTHNSLTTEHVVQPHKGTLKIHTKSGYALHFRSTTENDSEACKKHHPCFTTRNAERPLRAGSPHFLPYTKQPPVEPTCHFFQNSGTQTKICLHKEQMSCILMVTGFSALPSFCQPQGSFMEEVGPHCVSCTHWRLSSTESLQAQGTPVQVGPTRSSAAFLHPAPWTVPRVT